MPILTIVYRGDKSELLSNIYSIKIRLSYKNINIGIFEQKQNEFTIIKIYSSDDDISQEKINIIYTNFTEIIYKLIMIEFYNREIDDILNNNYFFIEENDAEDIKIKLLDMVTECSNINDQNEVYCINRMNEIKKNILDVLEDTRKIDIDGYLTFRLNKIRENTSLIIDKLVEKIITKNEYDEFIKLLKYFVSIEESKIDVLNIFINKNGEYKVVDKNGENLINNFKEIVYLDNNENDPSSEDIIISGLVTNCPKKINIYGVQNCLNLEFLNTIKKVFEEKVETFEEYDFISNDLNKNDKKNK